MLDVFTRVVLAGAFIFTFAWVVLAQRRTIKRLSDAYLRLSHFQRVVVALAVIVCTVYAQKPSTNDVEGVTGTNDVEIVIGGDTNDVEIVIGEDTNGVDIVEGGTNTNEELRVESGELMKGQTLMPSTLHPSSLTPNSDGARPYRLESVATNAGFSYAMPSDGTIRGTWHLTGAYEAVQKVSFVPHPSSLRFPAWLGPLHFTLGVHVG